MSSQIILHNIDTNIINKINQIIKESNSNISIIIDEEEITIKGNITTKIKIKDINYINVSNDRKLNYHLINGDTIESKSIQSGFRKEIKYLIQKDYMIFAAQAILINLLNIKSINKYESKITFHNNEELVIPKIRIESVYEAWIK